MSDTEVPISDEGEPMPEGRRAVPPAIGLRVNNYEIVAKIGEGGMGVVYLARHQFFERSAALKVLHPHFWSDGTLVRRFMTEARAANLLSHPNIIEVFDTGILAGLGAPYLLMEYLQGESLGARLGRLGRLPVPDALAIAAQTAAALAAAHEQGIIHRDLKPENLFLVPRSSGGDLVKVLDFGIAKLRPDLADDGHPTKPGELLGTPRYMSPEQCRGSWPVDQRSDVYALGIILYEMLCGTAPFVSDGIGEMLAIQLTREPEPLRTHLPSIPPAVEEAVLRALRKDPDQRFASMRELREALGPVAMPRLTPRTGHATAPDQATPGGPWTIQLPQSPYASLLPSPSPGRRRGLATFTLLALASLAAAGVWADRTGRLPLSALLPKGPALARSPETSAPRRELQPPPAVIPPAVPPPPQTLPVVEARAVPAPSKPAPPARRRPKPRREPNKTSAAPPSKVAAPPAEEKFVPPLW